MATVTTMSMLLPPPPAYHRYNRPSSHVDTLQLNERFWKAVKLDSPTSPTFDSPLNDSPIDDKIMRVVHVDENTTTFIDDPIVAYETLDCYSPNRPTFSSPTYYEDQANDPSRQPCPYGEPLGLCTNPAPTLGSIKYQEKPVMRSNSPWSGLTLRPTRFRKASQSSNHRQGPSVLALASAFLDSVVRLARSRSSTPTTFNDGQGSVTILESEVLVNVLEDGKRAGLYGGPGASLCGVEKALEKLEIPASSTISHMGNSRDSSSPITSTEGPATSAQELDAMSRVNWERQLSEAKARGLEERTERARGRSL